MLEDKILSIQDRSQKDFQILTNEIIEIKIHTLLEKNNEL